MVIESCEVKYSKKSNKKNRFWGIFDVSKLQLNKQKQRIFETKFLPQLKFLFIESLRENKQFVATE